MKYQDTWLCIRLTHLSVNSFDVCVCDGDPDTAIVFQNRIWQHNGSPTDSLITVGMTTSHAQALLPNLIIKERQPRLEKLRLESLAQWAYQFTSMVSINDNFLTLEIGKSLSLFNGLNHITNLVNNELINLKIEARLGISHTPQAALLISFSGGVINQAIKETFAPSLDTALVANLNVSEKTVDQLLHCGFTKLGDLLVVPNEELGKRFGVSFLNYLAHLLGDSADLQTTIIPPEKFESNIDFAEPISNISWITQQLERLLTDLCRFIEVRQLVCQSFTWQFFNEKNLLIQNISISLSHQAIVAQPKTGSSVENRMASTMLELTQLKIATLKFNWVISRIVLTSDRLVPKQLFNDDLFDPKPGQSAFNEFTDKLVSRLGAASVYQLKVDDAQLPELNNRRHQIVDQSPSTGRLSPMVPTEDGKIRITKDKPIWLLPKPKLISSKRSLPEYQGPLQIIHGPDRVVSHWWSTLQSRDYYIARQRSGRLVWLFFNRGRREWFLHGLFA